MRTRCRICTAIVARRVVRRGVISCPAPLHQKEHEQTAKPREHCRTSTRHDKLLLAINDSTNAKNEVHGDRTHNLW
jgi:hypothetical protein